MDVRKAVAEDFERIVYLYERARAFMAETGNPHQWGDRGYPPPSLTEADIAAGHLYVVCDGAAVHGVFMFSTDPDPTYRVIDGAWLNDEPYAVIHRIAASGEKKGVLATAVEFSKRFADNVRIDTHEENVVMQAALKKLGFLPCGVIYLENGDPRLAFQYRK